MRAVVHDDDDDDDNADDDDDDDADVDRQTGLLVKVCTVRYLGVG